MFNVLWKIETLWKFVIYIERDLWSIYEFVYECQPQMAIDMINECDISVALQTKHRLFLMKVT